MKEILNNIVTTATSVWHTLKRLTPAFNVAFEVFLLGGLIVSVWLRDYTFALYYLGIEILTVLFDIRKGIKKNVEVDLRMGGELVAGLISTFLKENPDYKLVKRTPEEPQVKDETRA